MVARALRSNGQAKQLAGLTNRKVANVDHLLNFAQAFRKNFATLPGDQLAKRLFVLTQLFAKQTNQFTTPRGWNTFPGEKGFFCIRDSGIHVAVGGRF